jgi:pimeloyl-ACP methyl ester carboxylesterase
LPSVVQPALIVWGSEDLDTPPSYAELMRRQIPNATLRVIRGAGHFPFVDRPDEFVKVIANFI